MAISATACRVCDYAARGVFTAAVVLVCLPTEAMHIRRVVYAVNKYTCFANLNAIVVLLFDGNGAIAFQ